MDEIDKLYIQQMKKELVATLDSGMLKPEDQYAMVNATLRQLLLLKDKEDDKLTKIHQTIKEYFEDQDKLNVEIEEAKKTIRTAIDKYADNAKNIYENIKKL